LARGKRYSETAIAEVLTSTRLGKNPLALYSTGLPILQVALNVEAMSANLQVLLGDITGEASNAHVRHANLVAYKQGNRGLIHYDVDGMPDWLGGIVLAKLYPDPSQAARVHQIVQRLWTDVFAGSETLGVPRPLGCVPELAMFVFMPVPGRFLADVILGDRGVEYLGLVAAWASALHRSRIPLDRRLDPERELVNVRAWAALVAHHHPEMAGAVEALAAPLREMVADLVRPTETPIHKDFHYQHVFVDSEVSVIDFDEVRLGDENFDLAHFCAHLYLLGCRTPSQPTETFSRMQQVFLDAYAHHSGWEKDARFTLFYSYTCLKLAKQLSTLRGVRPRPDGEEQSRQLRLVVGEGTAALNGS
jgi:hypothetical protein